MDDAKRFLEKASSRGYAVETAWEEAGVSYEGQRLELGGVTPTKETVRLSIENVLSRSGANLRSALPVGLTVQGNAKRDNAFEGEFRAHLPADPTSNAFHFNGINGAYRAGAAFLASELKEPPKKPAQPALNRVRKWFGGDSAVV